MFGYVNVLADELKVREYKQFKAYYCGLCRAMGKRCSQLSRIGLSYDMTFLAILLSSLSDKKTEYIKSGCVAHLFGKRTFVVKDEAVDYAADASVLLYYLKLSDDLHDDKSIKALFLMFFFRRAYKKACKRHPELSKSIKKHLDNLSNLENQNSADIDKCAECFAKITEEIFSPDFAEESSRQLKWLGYNIGRWIYVTDAFSDIEKDFKNNSFNPYLSDYKGDNTEKYKKEIYEKVNTSLTFTLANATSAFELIKIYKNKEILENILYISLPNKQDAILQKKEINKQKECFI